MGGTKPIMLILCANLPVVVPLQYHYIYCFVIGRFVDVEGANLRQLKLKNAGKSQHV